MQLIDFQTQAFSNQPAAQWQPQGMNPQQEAPTFQSDVQWQPQGMQTQLQAPTFQPSVQYQWQPQEDQSVQQQICYSGVEHHATLNNNVRGASDITMNPLNTLVLVASVFALLYSVYTLAIFALMLAPVARMYHLEYHCECCGPQPLMVLLRASIYRHRSRVLNSFNDNILRVDPSISL